MGVRAIGFWIDEDAPHLPDPAAFVDTEWAVEERNVVAAYLRGGNDIVLGQGCSTCRICGVPDGFEEFTDGRYRWPEGLAHYVFDHAVRLPDEVLEHVLRSAKAPTEVRLVVRT